MRKLIFKFTKWLIRRYFPEGLSPIYANDNPLTTEVIAWRWTFYDEAYDGKRLAKKLNYDRKR